MTQIDEHDVTVGIPQEEVDHTVSKTGKRISIICQFGCTSSSGLPQYFYSKVKYVEHLLSNHDGDFRLIIETPPNAKKGTYGHRHVLGKLETDTV